MRIRQRKWRHLLNKKKLQNQCGYGNGSDVITNYTHDVIATGNHHFSTHFRGVIPPVPTQNRGRLFEWSYQDSISLLMM